MRPRVLTRTVLLLSFVSLFTDIASEMLYPVMPMFLGSIGFSVTLIGILEGIAEATAGAAKGYFGRLSDSLGRRAVFVQAGYFCSAVSKPIMGLFTSVLPVFGARTLDRLGKGIRTGARDAMLSAETTPDFRGRVFGFHRAFDTVGAAIGPAAALLFLTLYPERYQVLFLLAFFPGILSSLMTLLLKDPVGASRAVASPGGRKGFFLFLRYWRSAPKGFRPVVAGLLAFALINSSDVLLLLIVRSNGASDQVVIGMYILYNIVYALLAYPLGALGDRIGLKVTFIGGLGLFAVVYGLIGFASSLASLAALFFVYGAFAAATEGISKAWLSTIVPREETATAIGFYTGLQSVCTLLASSLAGWLWWAFSPRVPFLVSSTGALVVGIYLALVPIRRSRG